ncbi:hypothetical protein DOTSEDRAFT_27786 [Dothistroma septosporum NZE10]|uniref:Uncharacterized protein n=1 Tax=Dothistroma septosporum (strain NZE10 / CBS 128990) TaxID=675120 RepID=N1PC97_DOTSN|nr:hypothetical protein DOTSEDRAFT_27786 [Dothistroma septosporum NZE10]
MAMHPHYTVNKLVTFVVRARSSVGGAASMSSMLASFISQVMATYNKFIHSNVDAVPDLVACELCDLTKVTSLDSSSHTNGGYHLNGVAMRTRFKKDNDAVCRQWARDINEMWKNELQKQGKATANG